MWDGGRGMGERGVVEMCEGGGDGGRGRDLRLSGITFNFRLSFAWNGHQECQNSSTNRLARVSVSPQTRKKTATYRPCKMRINPFTAEHA